MGKEANLALVKQMVEALNRGDLDAFSRCYSEGVVVELMNEGHRVEGKESLREWLRGALDSFESFKNEIIGVYDDDGRVALEVVASGTTVREFQGTPPGQHWENWEVYVYGFSDGLISEARCYS